MNLGLLGVVGSRPPHTYKVPKSQITWLKEHAAGIDSSDFLMFYRAADKKIRKTRFVSVTPFTKAYNSGEQTITVNGLLTLSHGLGEEPRLVQCHLVNVTGEHNYAVGMKILANLETASSGSDIFGASVRFTSTQILVRYGTAFLAHEANTGAQVTLTNANWRFIVRAFA